MAKQKKTASKPKTRMQFYRGDCETFLTGDIPYEATQLAILDPPYNLGKDYEAYEDKKHVSDYLLWLRRRVNLVYQALDNLGTLWLFINDGLVSEADLMCKSLGLHKRSHVVWYFTFGVHHQANFTASHCHLLRYSKSRTKWTFNSDSIRVPSARQLKYKDKRADPKGRVPDNTWVLFPEQLPDGFRPEGDVWLESRVCGTFHEREKHSPNQIPIPIMERIVLSTSNAGDVVLDPFMGSGSAGVACKRHGRSYIGIDLSQKCVSESKKRIERG